MAESRRVPIPRPAGQPQLITPAAPQHPGGGQLPFPTGQVTMTDHAQRELVKLGWRPGDPIPGDLGRIIAEMQTRVQKDKADAGETLATQGQKSPPRVGKLVNIDELPEADRRSLRQYLHDHKESIAQAQAIEQAQAAEEAALEADVTAGVVPEAVAQGLSSMSQVVRQTTAPKPEAVVVGALPPHLKVPEGKHVGGVMGVPLMKAPPPPPKPVQAAAPPPATPSTEPPPEHIGETNCPRCGYDNRVPFESKPTREDIEQFSAAMLSLQVFRKKYAMLGGKCSLLFRGLSSNDVILINKQLGYEVRAGKIIGDGEYITAMFEYRLVLSLQRIEVQGHIAADMPTVIEYAKANSAKMPSDPSKETILVKMHEEFYDKYVANESLRRIVGTKHREFQRLSETLEAMMLDPNFTSGIALSA